MHYLVTIGHEDSESGRVKKVKYVFEAESVEESTIVAAKYMAGDTRTSELLGVNNMPIECVITPSTHPELYKTKKREE
jgi:hypothetical protein